MDKWYCEWINRIINKWTEKQTDVQTRVTTVQTNRWTTDDRIVFKCVGFVLLNKLYLVKLTICHN